MRLTRLLTVVLMLCATCAGQYEITQSVIANGGGSSNGGSYSITGTAAQSVAGVQSSESSIGIRGGFWQSFLVPTAANVTISGRVTDAWGTPLPFVRVKLEGAITTRSTLTNPFGYFDFEDVEVGRVYIVSGYHRRFEFVPTTIVVKDSISDIEIVALP